MKRLLSRARVKAARAKLAGSPTSACYFALASEHARLGEMDEALRVCEEGLGAFPDHPELKRLADRARQIELEDRTRSLARELRESPRPALYKELCELMLASGRVARAEECAEEWLQATGDPNATLLRAQARLERFFSDRRREDGKRALELIEECEQKLPSDLRALRLHLAFASRVGAWRDARKLVSQLLELAPGDPVLEARFRTLMTLAETAPTAEQALREVERTGRLVDDEPEGRAPAPSSQAIRPMLKALGADAAVQAAIYTRGSTALVQGPRGATAERTARSVREVVQHSRTTARRLGLGQAEEVLLEGDFGSLLIAPSEMGAAAVWCVGGSVLRHRAALLELVGAAGEDEA